MKFAEYIQENLVPEWKDKYLDYKAGKKKIKKIASSPKSASLSSQLAQTPNPNSNNEGNETRSSSQTYSADVSNDFKNFNFKERQPQEAFELPPAALDPLEESLPLHRTSQTVANDHTPLLKTINQKRIPSYSSAYENHLTLRKAGKIPQSVDLTASANTYGGDTPAMEGIQLENFVNTAFDDFLEWLDKELRKIDTFYKEKEEKTVERYLLIQDQLYVLKEERELMKQRNRVEGGGDKKKDTFIRREASTALKARSKLAKIQKLELPSLPKFPFLRRSPSPSPSSNGKSNTEDLQRKRDYEIRPHQDVPYYAARRQLKAALQEFYRELELIRSYRMLNRTGFRKLLKKCDKQTNSNILPTYMEKVNSSYFATSDVLENLIPKLEDLYSLYFENGNRKVAVEKLRSDLGHDTYYSPLFLAGLFIGVAIPLFCYALFLGLHKTFTGEIAEGRFLLQIWAGFLLMLLITMLFTINCYIWHKYKVNYKFIFEFNPHTALDFREFIYIPAFSLLLFAIFSWFSFNNFWPDKLNAIYWPWFFLGSMFILIFIPAPIFYYESRKWLIVTTWRLFLSGLYPVEFRDFFLGDILCSLSYSMGNISFFFCIYATHWQGASDGTTMCSSSNSHLMGFFSALPPIWRFLQCIRRYLDSGDWFPHLANMVKYSFTVVYYLTLSNYRINKSISTKAVFVFFASVNSIFSGLWDIFMDWSLMQNTNLLRDDIVYPAWFYYFAIVSDLILRFQWVFYALFGKQIEQSAFTSFAVGIAEIFRRFIWLLIRMENEHVTNIHLYRAARETPLPYQTVSRSANLSRTASRKTTDADQQRQSPRPQREPEQRIPFNTSQDLEAQHTPDTLRRRKTLLDPDMFKNMSKAIVNAHAKDFQRKKQNGRDGEEANNSSDDDDVNSDGETGSILES